MGRPPGDTSSSVGAEVGTDAGSRGRGGGGSGYGGAGGRGSGYGEGYGDGDGDESDRGMDEDDMEAFSSHSSLSAAAVVGRRPVGTAGAAAGAGVSAAGSHLSGMDESEAEERREALETFMAVTQVGSSATAAQFLDATDWSPDAAINLFLESGGDALTATSATAERLGGGSSGYGAEARGDGGGGAPGWPGTGGSGYDEGDDEVWEKR